MHHEEPWDDSLYVVRLPDGSVPDPHIFARGVKVALTKLGLPVVTFHDLSHSHATWLLESGVDLKVISQRLGHSTITVTADEPCYTSAPRRCSKKLEDMMGGETNHKNDL
ncbi:tyrosine-type recombinase/integrase [Alicyclobacillus fastidiosus]|uniref:Tyrosine-type recombinase/integrase n=1 Tax=Alicyclobacillus fastidiosus TaxID=392011 RepID=A0ABY6ZRT6_9BACL|nr:tyrosine-type recombinase/integrase [Alicyclobacillus fastidiosus]WAH44675.1 tyrosine-type recombinase/integrase [Alicyclobacillus fastidiosus]